VSLYSCKNSQELGDALLRADAQEMRDKSIS